MKNQAIKFSTDIAEKIQAAFASAEFKGIVTAAKEASEENGTFEVVISSEATDRQGEVVKMDGWSFDNYMKNPIVLWGHDYKTLPIGVCTELRIEEGKLIAKGVFVPESVNPMAQMVRRGYDLGLIKATSVGFIATEMEGNVITKAELLEFSFVTVPANPEALSLMVERGLSVDTYIAKGIVSAKGEVEEAMNMEEVIEAKYQNMNKAWDIMCAFADVYMRDETPVEDFSKLVKETAELLSKLGDMPMAEEPVEGEPVVEEGKAVASKKAVKLFELFTKMDEEGELEESDEVLPDDEDEQPLSEDEEISADEIEDVSVVDSEEEKSVTFTMKNGAKRKFNTPVIAKYVADNIAAGRKAILPDAVVAAVDAALEAMKGAGTALEDLKATAESSEGGNAETPSEEDGKNVTEDFLDLKTFIQTIDTMVGEKLAEAKKRARANGIKVR